MAGLSKSRSAVHSRSNTASELSPESETLSGDIFMSKKISAEIRLQVLLLLRQGARAQSIATQLRLTKSWVQQC